MTDLFSPVFGLGRGNPNYRPVIAESRKSFFELLAGIEHFRDSGIIVAGENIHHNSVVTSWMTRELLEYGESILGYYSYDYNDHRPYRKIILDDFIVNMPYQSLYTSEVAIGGVSRPRNEVFVKMIRDSQKEREKFIIVDMFPAVTAAFLRQAVEEEFLSIQSAAKANSSTVIATMTSPKPAMQPFWEYCDIIIVDDQLSVEDEILGIRCHLMAGEEQYQAFLKLDDDGPAVYEYLKQTT